MQIYLLEKTSTKRLINLGAKITLNRLNNELNKGNTILIRSIEGDFQSDIRLRKVPETTKMDRGFRTVKEFYVANMELGKKGFEKFFPKEVSHEQNLRFASLERALNMLEVKQKINRADWIVDKK